MQRRSSILIGAVDLIQGDVADDCGPLMAEVGREIGSVLDEAGFLDSAPFATISLIYRFGLRRCFVVDYGPINTKHNELPVAVELKMRALEQMNREELRDEFTAAAVAVVCDVARKYGLSTEGLERLGGSGV